MFQKLEGFKKPPRHEKYHSQELNRNFLTRTAALKLTAVKV